ncbi:hypothetical protein [Kitasatospora sp. MAA4]|uniref:hypothetical protein n=1 Tax=Kitasatospora sp. MAA4 TaxID=3035093 RepID=UPI002474B9D4|nr:hypothetical protein [Kitasatospora sp. MAA4]
MSITSVFEKGSVLGLCTTTVGGGQPDHQTSRPRQAGRVSGDLGQVAGHGRHRLWLCDIAGCGEQPAAAHTNGDCLCDLFRDQIAKAGMAPDPGGDQAQPLRDHHDQP